MKKFFFGLLSICFLLLAGALAIPFLVPAEELKGAALAWLEKATGREVSIEGPIHLAVFPEIALELGEVSIGNPAGARYASPRFARVESLALSLQLKPLLEKRIEVDALTLIKLEIWLEETPTRQQNWGESSGGSKKDSGFQFALNRLTIQGGTVHFSRSGMKVKASAMEADWRGEALKFSSDVLYNGTAYAVDAKASRAQSFLRGEATPLSLNLQSGGAQVDFSGEASGGVKQPVLQGRLNATLPEHKLTLASANAKLTPKKLSFTQLDLGYGEIQAGGNLEVSLTGAIPAVKGALEIAEITQPPSEEAAAEGQGGSASPGWNTDPVDVSALRRADADLSLKIGRYLGERLQLHQIQAQVKNKAGRLAVTLEKSTLLGGSLTGRAALDASGATPRWEAEGRLSHVAAEEVLALATEKSRLTGTLNGEFAFAGRGASQAAWMQSLSGGGNFSVRDGVISGYSLPKLFRNLQAEAARGEETKYSEILLRFTADAGVMSLQEASLKATGLEAEVSGTIDLGDRHLNLTLRPRLVPKYSAENVEAGQAAGLLFPVRVKGPFEDVSVRPDVKAGIADALQDPAQAKENFKILQQEGKALIKGLEDRKDAIKEDWKALKDGKSPEALGKLLNELDRSGIPLPQMLDVLKTPEAPQEDPAGPAGGGAGAGEQPDPGAVIDLGGEDPASEQPPAADQGGAAGQP